MQIKLNKFKDKLYIYFLLIALFKIFFSTSFLQASTFEVKNTQISKKFDINFDKNKVIDVGFKIAFDNLILKIAKSNDYSKLKKVSINNLKTMIDTFSIKEERFIDNIYYANIDVSFNKKKIYNFFEKQNIFPSLPKEKKILLIPILINEDINEISLFSENIFFRNWVGKEKSNFQLNYILPVDDLDDIKIIKENINFIEEYNFKEIINKYAIDGHIVSLIYKDKDQLKVLSKINLKDELIIDNQIFENKDFNNDKQLNEIINKLKIIYEDYWKEENQINTSIKLPLSVSISSKDQKKINYFEKSLSRLDLISEYYIYKFDSQNTYYRIIFNGTPKIFLSRMQSFGLQLDIQKKIWKLK
tara:strand:- start:5371 stop:6447 length:1077 start_codon:yes stop_codon:yes gene_type:complete